MTFVCPVCDCPGRLELPAPAEWTCPGCSCQVPLTASAPGPALDRCALCGNQELYRKKDFPHRLGMTLLTLAFVGATITYSLYLWQATWAILLTTAAFDGLLYLWVKDVVVCYRCNAHFRGLPPDRRFAPFELGIGERYRQERLRREQLEADRREALTPSTTESQSH
jgi:hypothetical protein